MAVKDSDDSAGKLIVSIICAIIVIAVVYAIGHALLNPSGPRTLEPVAEKSHKGDFCIGDTPLCLKWHTEKETKR